MKHPCADHPVYTADQIERHEAGHKLIERGEIDFNRVREKVAKAVGGKENLDKAAELYEAAYSGTGMTPQEIWEECICDSLGDMNIFAKNKEVAGAMDYTIKEVQKAVAEQKTEPNKTRGSPEASLSNTRNGKNGWGKKFGTAQEALNDAIQSVDTKLWNSFNKEFDSNTTNHPITNAINAVMQDVRQDTITPMQGAMLLSQTYEDGGVDALSKLYNHKTGNLHDNVLDEAKQIGEGKASRELKKKKGKIAKYLSESQVGQSNMEYIRHQLYNLYSGISDGIADGIAIANGKTVFIVDSGKDNGKLDFGVRRKRTISADIGREQFIRSENDKSRQEGNISDELLERIEYAGGSNIGRNLRRELGEELQVDKGKSANNQSGISQKNGDNRGLGKSSRELDTDYLTAVEQGDMETAQKMVDEAATNDLNSLRKILINSTSKKNRILRLSDS